MSNTSTCTLLAVLAVATGCATAPAPAPRPLAMTVLPGKFAEECFRLDAGERIDYRFTASGEVDFNLHTHRGNEVVMPVDVKRTRGQSGTYASPRDEDYCLMWTNEGQHPARIDGQWRRLAR